MHIISVNSNYGHREFIIRLSDDENKTDKELLEYCGYTPFLGGSVNPAYGYSGKVYKVKVYSN